MRHTTSLFVTCGTAALVFAAGAASAQVAQTPLTLATGVKPNLLLAIDDSGSMDWEVLFPTEGGQLHWNFDSDLPVDANGNLYTTEQGRAYSYLFPNGSGSGNKLYSVDSANGQALAPRPEYAFARSARFNKQYYDPAVTYRPWVSMGGQTFVNAVPTAAISDPMVSDSATIDLTSELYVTSGDEWKFTTSGGSRGADSNGKPSDSTTANRAYHAYRYFPATYYVPLDTGIALPSWLGSGRNCATPDPQTFRTFVLNWSNARQTALEGLGVDSIGPGGICLRKVEVKPGNSFPGGRSYDDEIRNFANWFVYHRKRHLALRAGMGEALVDIGGVRAGAFTINNRSSPTMWDLDTSRTALYDFVYGLVGNSGGTPNRQALNYAGNQFNRTRNPIITAACQQNFTLLFTDGYANTLDGSGYNVGNADSGLGAPFQDSHSNTIADVAMHWYKGRMRTDLAAGKVPVPAECSSSAPPKYLACNSNLHMRTFGVTLGAQGEIFGNTHHSTMDAHTTPPAWANPTQADRPVQVDDLYHAVVNSRGELLNATSTVELSARLRQALQSILDAEVSSASSVASNSTRLDTGTLIYQARFDPARWSGQILAFALEPDGSLGDLEWDAGGLVPSPESRTIITRNSGGTAVSFEWGNLSAAQQTALNADADGTADGRGEARLAYLRGVRSGERQYGGVFRDRDRALGDIVNSNPWFMGDQNFAYERLPASAAGRDSYQTFRAGLSTRRKMLFVGANDGMLHAFDALTGVERWAYIPSQLVPSLRVLTDPRYRHRYFVDGSPVVGDAYYDAAWKSVLVGTLGAGGRGVFALDVTNPDSFGTGSVLWEFTDAQDANLGHVIGRASIARMANGEWAAIFGSGYGSGKAARLYIRNLKTGAEIKTLSTVHSTQEASAVANGLASPLPVDLDGDTITDVIYAGDLYGNLWKFDVSGNANSWDVAFKQGNSPRPLFTACASGDASGPFACAAASRQPITTRPVAGYGQGGVMVYFGTGKFFETGDNIVDANTPKQTFYAVLDANARVAGRSALTQQTITSEATYDHDGYEYELRTTSNTLPGANSKGWYLDVVSPNGAEGERIVASPVLREGRIIFATLIPSGDACDAGGSSWLMELSAATGSRLPHTPFDANNDGVIDASDATADGTAASGVRSTVGIIQTPTIIEIPGTTNEVKISSGSEGGLMNTLESRGATAGRTSWRQLWPD